MDAERRRRFARIADGMIPEADGMPAATAAGIAEGGLDTVLRARPDLLDRLARALDQEPENPIVEWLDELHARDSEAHDTLVLAVVAGYYLNGEIMRRLGYPGQEAIAVNPDTYPPYIEHGLLDAVLDRGPIYRPTPGLRAEA